MVVVDGARVSMMMWLSMMPHLQVLFAFKTYQCVVISVGRWMHLLKVRWSHQIVASALIRDQIVVVVAVVLISFVLCWWDRLVVLLAERGKQLRLALRHWPEWKLTTINFSLFNACVWRQRGCIASGSLLPWLFVHWLERLKQKIAVDQLFVWSDRLLLYLLLRFKRPAVHQFVVLL